MKVVVLLSTYNGEKYLREQLNSLINQSYKDVDILVRDDGSSDSTKKILDEYKNAGKLDWYAGENLGASMSFWHLLHHCHDADYYAFCDQDDVWDKDKLQIAINKLNKEDNSIPLLYCSDVRVVDSKLNLLSEHMVAPMPVDYPHALIRNLAPGCTFVFNNAAKLILSQYDVKLGVELHDWLTYQIVLCFGKVYYDLESHLSYRQHQENVIGDIRKGRKQKLKKAKSFLWGEMKNSRQKNALKLEQAFGNKMSNENLRITEKFAHYLENKEFKKALLKSDEIRFSGTEYLFFKLLVMLKRF